MKFFSNNYHTVIEWLGQSPDLNPIENLLAIVKRHLQLPDRTIASKLIEAIISVWYRNEKIIKMCEKLMEAMLKKVSQVIENREDYINYKKLLPSFIIAIKRLKLKTS